MRRHWIDATSHDQAAAKLLEPPSEYLDAENLAPYPFEYRPKQPHRGRASECRAAHRRGIPYQRYIRRAVENAHMERKTP
jgi:hypothetical protein